MNTQLKNKYNKTSLSMEVKSKSSKTQKKRSEEKIEINLFKFNNYIDWLK
jgi:hypothetical protein